MRKTQSVPLIAVGLLSSLALAAWAERRFGAGQGATPGDKIEARSRRIEAALRRLSGKAALGVETLVPGRSPILKELRAAVRRQGERLAALEEALQELQSVPELLQAAHEVPSAAQADADAHTDFEQPHLKIYPAPAAASQELWAEVLDWHGACSVCVRGRLPDSKAPSTWYYQVTEREFVAVAWSPDGRYLAYQTMNYGGHQPYYQRITVVDFEANESLDEIEATEGALFWSDEGVLHFTALGDGWPEREEAWQEARTFDPGRREPPREAAPGE